MTGRSQGFTFQQKIRLKSRHSGKVLDVHTFSTTDSADIVQCDWGGNNQQRQLVRAG
ncbi:RICIN domain-containing protein [Nonomuraea sp. NPDC050643]|uniref:RICIN domain-containing protein n=1 Tax=Nonomuraea sp. NPDC050643 TaxID=3155660 RepID=UPI0033C3CBEF